MDKGNLEEAGERVARVLENADKVLSGENIEAAKEMGREAADRLIEQNPTVAKQLAEARILEEFEPVVMGRAIPTGTAIVSIDPGMAPAFAKHLEAANRILEIATTREILNEVDAKAANDDLNVMLELTKAVDVERKTFTGPLNEYVNAINAAYKVITGPLMEATQITKKILTAYKVEQQRKAAEVEELNRKAMEVAREQAKLNQGEFTTDITPVPVPPAPKLTRTDQGTSGLVDNWKYEVVDIDLLPREYMIPDDAMLKSIATKQHDKKPVKGVRFYNEPGLRVTKR